MFVPPKGAGAEMLGKDPAEVARRIKELVEDKLR
jgi:DNA-binding Lrp family transcriptional regulator